MFTTIISDQCIDTAAYVSELQTCRLAISVSRNVVSKSHVDRKVVSIIP